MVLKTDFLRGEENAQDGLNDNFVQISEALNIGGGYGQQIGDVHISISPANPSERFGGTWERFAKGRTLVGVNENDVDFETVQKTGGSKTVSVGESNLPNFALVRSSGGTGAGWNMTSNVASGFRNGAATDLGVTRAIPLNNIQPYITVYMWVRTA